MTIDIKIKLIISKELNFISEENYDKLRVEIGKISRMLNALRKAHLNN